MKGKKQCDRLPEVTPIGKWLSNYQPPSEIRASQFVLDLLTEEAAKRRKTRRRSGKQ